MTTPHGIPSGYTYRACRCGLCSEAFRIYHRQLRAKTLADMATDPRHHRHGTEYGYRCGCRCTRCTDAKSAHSAAYKARKKADS